MIWKAILSTAVVVVLLGYTLYERFPDGIAQESSIRVQRLGFLCVVLYSKIHATVTGGNVLVSMRNIFKDFLPKPRPFVDEKLKIYDTEFDGIKVRVYQPKNSNGSRPGLVYYHGGGWFMFSTDVYDNVTRNVARGADIVVISVEYRLVPEVKYPVPLEDCIVATKHFIKNAKNYGVDPMRVAVAGDSSGGDLAVAVALKLRDEVFNPPIKAQILLYPLLQFCTQNLPIHHILSGLIDLSALFPNFLAQYVLTDEEEFDVFNSGKYMTNDIQRACQNYVSYKYIPDAMVPPEYQSLGINNEATGDVASRISKKFSDPYAFPLMARDFRNLPQAYIFTCELDELRDDGIIYAKRLEGDGVKVQWVHYSNATHGVFSFEEYEVYNSAFNNLLDFINKML